MAATGAIQNEKALNGGIQWHLWYSRPGHAASGDALCITPAHCHGYQNGQQRRYLFPIVDFLSDINVAKGPCYSPFILMPSYNINLIGVISLFVRYWPSPTTINAVSATIVADGHA